MKNLIFLITILLISCQSVKPQRETQLNEVPEWSEKVIWYQIFVDRFSNGDLSNDPTAVDISGAYPGFVPDGWKITPWGQDWYKDDDYFQNITEEQKAGHNGFKTFGQKSQLRRYGGDLQGVMDKLDYLEDLGITAIYFNPLNDAPSLHKYDARNWRHIDVNFGPNPDEDKRIMASEDPADPLTWKFTNADKLFLKVIHECHKRRIKVILDYSWNHTGVTFWAWQDILKNQERSAYKDWYWVEKFDDPTTAENEFRYSGWLGVKSLPEIRETVKQHHQQGIKAFEGNISSQEVKDLIFSISKRWLDPDNDGNPEDGIDGFRLDVAAEIPLGFWRDYRKFVRGMNPEAFILGEVWYEQFPGKLLDPAPFLKGDVFDAVMNYRWYRAARSFFSQPHENVLPKAFTDSLNRYSSNLNDPNNRAMMNMISGHDSPRVLTSLYNKTPYKYNANPEADPDYNINRPDEATYRDLKLLLVHQFTYVGSPNIWNGDEMGMWGGDDPHNRKPLIWKYIRFEDEKAHPSGLSRPVDKVEFNDDIFNWYKKLIDMRKSNKVLSLGEISFLRMDDEKNILAYERYDDSDKIIVVFNNSETSQLFALKELTGYIWKELLTGNEKNFRNRLVEIELEPKSVIVLKRLKK